MKTKQVFGWIGIITILIYVSNPLRLPEWAQEYKLLISTPYGSTMEEVKAYAIEQDWAIRIYDEESGFYHGRDRRYKGSKSIIVDIGNYQGIPWKAYVTVCFGFNEQSKLTDIWVMKTWDGI